MKKFILVILYLSIGLGIFGHTVTHTTLDKGVGVEVKYVDGTPMSFSSVKLFSPTDSQTPFQEGNTDKNGRFIFYPDTKGLWKIEVNDGMGHGLLTDININEEFKAVAQHEHSGSVFEKLIMGICIIWGLTGVILFIKVKRALKQKITHKS